MDNPDYALEKIEQAIPQEDQAAMADVFMAVRGQRLHIGLSFP